jgi:2-dehydropantoate 2-reductase
VSDRLRVGVVGAGAIGRYVGGSLRDTAAADVVLVGRRAMTTPRETITTDLGAVAGCDAALVCVKSAQTAEVGAALAGVLGDGAVVASLQNGVRNADVLRDALPGRRVLAGIVGFNVERGTSGPIQLEASDAPAATALVAALRAAGLTVETHVDLVPHQWTKLLVNLNNAVSALTGAPTREIILSPALRRIVAALIGEARTVLRAATIKPAALRGIPLGVVAAGLRMPTMIVKLLARAQLRVHPEARSSMWEDLERGRPTEVDYLNGEIVALAATAGVAAPLSRRIVELVHAAERRGPGSPRMPAAALWSALHA